jgi:hypothetical protein
MMARGAAVAAKSRAAMIRNHWGGNVARCAFMAGKCVLILKFRKMILFKGLEVFPKPLIQLAVSSQMEAAAVPTAGWVPVVFAAAPA